jgi:hypothetical protein
MNTRQIQPITTWTPDGSKTISYLSLCNFSDYHFDNGGGKVEYKLIGMSDGDVPIAIDYFVGTLVVPSDIIQQWGTSDDIIWNYVANTLDITLL